MALLGNLLVNIRANAEKYVREMENARRRTRAMQKTTNELRGAFRNAATAALSLAGVAGIGAMVRSSLEGANAIQKLQQRIGGTAEELTALTHVFQINSVSVDQGAMALQRMTRRVSEAAAGTGEAKNALIELNLNAGKLANMGLTEQYLAVAEALNGVKNQGRQTALAMKLFDSEGVKLLQTMQNGAAGIREMMTEAERLGVVMGQEQVDAAVRALDAMERLRAAFRGMANTLAVQLAPHIEAAANFFSQNFPAALEWTRKAFGALRHFMIEGVVKILQAMRALSSAFDNLGPKTKAALETVADVFPSTIGRAAQAIIDLRQAMGGFGATANLDRQIETLLGLQNAYAISTGEVQRYSAATRELLPDLENLAKGVDKATEAQKRQTKALQSTALAMTREVETAAERYTRKIAEAEDLLRQGLITIPTYARVVQKYFDALHDSAEKVVKPMKEGMSDLERAGQRVGDTLLQAFTTAARTGKFEFKDMVSSILTDLSRLMVKKQLATLIGGISGGSSSGGGLLSGIGSALGGVFGGLFSSSSINMSGAPGLFPGFAAGGMLPPGGGPVVVGERGPELLMGASGRVVPNDELGGGRTVNITFNVQALDGSSVIQMLQQNRRVIAGLVAGELEAKGAHSALLS